jgi:hypothetical protein
VESLNDSVCRPIGQFWAKRPRGKKTTIHKKMLLPMYPKVLNLLVFEIQRLVVIAALEIKNFVFELTL